MASDANSNNKNDLPSSISIKLGHKQLSPMEISLYSEATNAMDICLGTKECPKEFITSPGSSKNNNPVFEEWQTND